MNGIGGIGGGIGGGAPQPQQQTDQQQPNQGTGMGGGIGGGIGGGLGGSAPQPAQQPVQQPVQQPAQPVAGVGGGIGGGLGSTPPPPPMQTPPAQEPAPQTVAGVGGGLGGGFGTAPAQAPPVQQPMGGMAPGGVVSLTKGQKVSLTKVAQDAGIADPGNLSRIKVGLGWDVNTGAGAAMDLDVFTFALKADGKVRHSGDFIFFNNMVLDNGSIRLSGDNRSGVGEGDDESVLVDLNALPADIQKVVFAITISDAEAKGQNFGMVNNSFVRLVDERSGMEFLRYNLNEKYSTETALIVGEVYKHNGEWRFLAVGSGYTQGLVALCADYGVQAE